MQDFLLGAGGVGGGTSIAYSGFVRGFFVGVVGRLIACV